MTTIVERVVDGSTGEILKDEVTKTYRSDEPPFVKTYINDIGRLHGLNKRAISVLFELIKRVNYQDEIALSLHIKKTMQNSIGFKNVRSVDQGMNELIKAGFLVRVARGSFILDPTLFAQGEWRDIREFANQTIKMTITYNEKGREIRTAVGEKC